MKYPLESNVESKGEDNTLLIFNKDLNQTYILLQSPLKSLFFFSWLPGKIRFKYNRKIRKCRTIFSDKFPIHPLSIYIRKEGTWKYSKVMLFWRIRKTFPAILDTRSHYLKTMKDNDSHNDFFRIQMVHRVHIYKGRERERKGSCLLKKKGGKALKKQGKTRENLIESRHRVIGRERKRVQVGKRWRHRKVSRYWITNVTTRLREEEVISCRD